MFDNRVNVKVKWYGKKALNLPASKQYITVAKFSEDLNWENDAWSIVLEFKVTPKEQGNPSHGNAHFLMPNAPWEKLQIGNKFELYEGDALVAEVEVM